MTNDISTPDSPRRRHLAPKIALLGAGIAAGVIGATAVGASAQTSSTTAGSGSTSSTAASTATGTPAQPGTGHGGAAPVRSDEKAVSSSITATLKAAALKAVPGGTVYRVETEAGDGTYEAHMTKADGSRVTVKLDASFNVTGIEDGPGK